MNETAAAQLTTFDYEDWTSVLREHVDDSGRVTYRKLKADRTHLDRFVAMLGAVGPESRPDLFPTRADKLAYYINAYNAFTLFNVINRLPDIQSVMDDKTSFFYFTVPARWGRNVLISARE